MARPDTCPLLGNHSIYDMRHTPFKYLLQRETNVTFPVRELHLLFCRNEKRLNPLARTSTHGQPELGLPRVSFFLHLFDYFNFQAIGYRCFV